MSEQKPASEFAKYLPHGYRKRTVFVDRRPAGPQNVASYWDGGSRACFTLHRGGGAQPVGVDPHSHGMRACEMELQPGDVLVEHGTFCGKTATARITFVELAPVPAEPVAV
jgi:hypothetical protein